MRPTTARLTDAALLGAFATVTTIAVVAAGPGDVASDIGHRLTTGLGFMISVTSLFLVAVLMTLEHIFPAREEERGFSPSMAFDALYLLIQLPVMAVALALLTSPISNWLSANASFLVLDSTRELPMLVLLVLGVALSDFFLWFSHLVRHKVKFLWRFHMIHHSQTRLSLFTASRDHPFDSMFEAFIRLMPLVFLFPTIVENAQALVLYGLGVSWHIRFTHTNLRTNLGPLRYILVTPQSHRIHHSSEPEHWNSNYANVFCWDRLFGLQHADDTSYPTTGVNDVNFPEPKTLSPKAFAAAYLAQLRFPFDEEAVKRATHGSPPVTANDQALAA
ncbi:MAG: sterol desaturase family protein [Acidimicrobiia bacterium]|nr:sterol desaturase family protein [Acidimicrobiia bacterium]